MSVELTNNDIEAYFKGDLWKDEVKIQAIADELDQYPEGWVAQKLRELSAEAIRGILGDEPQ